MLSVLYDSDYGLVVAAFLVVVGSVLYLFRDSLFLQANGSSRRRGNDDTPQVGHLIAAPGANVKLNYEDVEEKIIARGVKGAIVNQYVGKNASLDAKKKGGSQKIEAYGDKIGLVVRFKPWGKKFAHEFDGADTIEDVCNKLLEEKNKEYLLRDRNSGKVLPNDRTLTEAKAKGQLGNLQAEEVSHSQ